MKIFVAIPVYDGKLHVESVRCLFSEQHIASGIGDVLTVNFLSSMAGIAHGRNQLASEFMKSDADRMIFLDSDVTFEPGALAKLAHMPADFVGGCYRYKRQEECYPMGWLNDPDSKGLRMDKHGLIEVNGLPTGFLALSRKVFQTMKDRFPERELQEHFGHKMFAYFQMPFINGHLHGEDNFFCREWREAGGKIYLDPEIKLTHWDFNPTPYVGHIGAWIKGSPETKMMLEKLKGIENEQGS